MGKSVHVREDEVLAALLKVKPTDDMPRPGANKQKPKKTEKRK